jgi:PAS domain S-box-containing protein
MKTPADSGIIQRLNSFAYTASLFSVAVGLSVLAGWTFHILTLLTWGFSTTMAPNAAACVVLAGISLWLQRKTEGRPPPRARKLAAQCGAAVVSVVGLFTLIEHIFHLNAGIDRALLLAPPPPSARVLMSPVAAGFFVFFGLALLLIDWRTTRDDWPAQFLCLGAATAPAFGILGLLLGPAVSVATLALPAVVCYSLLTAGLLCSRADWALGGLLTSHSPGAKLLRKAIPGSLLALGLFAWTISKPLLTDAHISWVRASFLAILGSAILAGFVVWTASIIDRSDADRRKIEAALHVSKEELDRLLDRIEEPQAEAVLRRRVKLGVAAAILLTAFLGILSWRSAQQAAQDADWVAHTHEVSTVLELMLRHLVDVETGGRGFAVTGNQQFLEPYKSGRSAVADDLEGLSHLVADNLDQSRRLVVLRREASDRIAAADALVALRLKSATVPGDAQLQPGKQLMDAARTTVEAMETEEKSLLTERAQRSRSARDFSNAAIELGSSLGAIFLAVAGFTLSREIGISARARAKVSALNADLERRVAQRTAALGESEGRLAGIIRSAMDAILTVDEQHNVVLFNSAAEKVFLCPAAEAIRQPLTRFIPSRFHAAHAGHIHKFSETGVNARAMGRNNILWAVRADGREFQIESSISQVFRGRLWNWRARERLWKPSNVCCSPCWIVWPKGWSPPTSKENSSSGTRRQKESSASVPPTCLPSGGISTTVSTGRTP